MHPIKLGPRATAANRKWKSDLDVRVADPAPALNHTVHTLLLMFAYPSASDHTNRKG